jgi:hypothetical protein
VRLGWECVERDRKYCAIHVHINRDEWPGFRFYHSRLRVSAAFPYLPLYKKIRASPIFAQVTSKVSMSDLVEFDLLSIIGISTKENSTSSNSASVVAVAFQRSDDHQAMDFSPRSTTCYGDIFTSYSLKDEHEACYTCTVFAEFFFPIESAL